MMQIVKRAASRYQAANRTIQSNLIQSQKYNFANNRIPISSEFDAETKQELNTIQDIYNIQG